MYSSPVDPRLLEQALTYCLDFGKEMIRRKGEFYAFGAVISSAGKVEAVGADLGEEHPQPEAVYRLLQNSLQQRFKEKAIIASAIAAHVDIPREYSPKYADGIRVHLEATGFSRFIYLPYFRPKIATVARLFGKKPDVSYGDMISVDVPSQVCAQATGT